MKRHTAFIMSGSLVAASFILSGTALAQTQASSGGYGGQGYSGQGQGHRPGVFGTVTAISGSSITIDSKGFGPNAVEATYTIDASNATVTKNNATASLGDIAVGDTVMAQGTVSGTSVTATSIRDGVMQRTGSRSGGTGGTRPDGQSAPNSATDGAQQGAGNGDAASAPTSPGDQAASPTPAPNAVTGDTGQDPSNEGAATSSTDDQQSAGGFLDSISSFFQHLFSFL